jgi:hypothetical protein
MKLLILCGAGLALGLVTQTQSPSSDELGVGRKWSSEKPGHISEACGPSMVGSPADSPSA